MIDPTDRPVYGALHSPPPPQPAARPRRRSVLPWLIAAIVLAFAVGLLTNPWFEQNVRSRLPGGPPAAAADDAASRELSALRARLASLEARARRPAPALTDRPAGSLPLAGSAEAQASVEARVAELQAQVAELRGRTDSSIAVAAEGAERAQTALLVAALRRAVDGGQRFDAYEPALRARFGTTHPNEVAALLALGRRPLSHGQLAQSLTLLAPSVDQAEAEGRSWWDSLQQGLSAVVAVRRADAPAVEPAAQLKAAEARAAAGDVEGALRLVAFLPPSSRNALAGWTTEARRYLAGTQALAALEVAALAPAPVTAPATPTTL